MTKRAVVDPVKAILRYNAGREPERLAMKYRAMCESPFVFLRGTCHLFHQQLPRVAVLERAPAVWCCGDLHYENFGSYRGDNRLTYFDINDFDEAALAPLTWELVRLLASVHCAASELGLKRSRARAMCGHVVDSYAQALCEGRARWIERDTATGLIQELLEALRKRTRADFVEQRTRQEPGGARAIKLDPKRALAADAKHRARASRIMERFAKTQPEPDFYKVLDVARRVAGTGSLGVERYVVLVRGKQVAGAPDENHLLDLKLALPSSLDGVLRKRGGPGQPAWRSPAARCVAVQQRVQAVPMARLHAIESRGRSYVLRGLLPSQDRVTLDPKHTQPDELTSVLGDMARLAAWAHLRASGRQGSGIADELIAFGRRREKWAPALQDAAEDCAARVRSDWKAWVDVVGQRGEAALAGAHAA